MHVWDVKDGHLTEGRKGKPIVIKSPYGSTERAPVFRALAACPMDEDFMLGTASCDIWEVNSTKQVRRACPPAPLLMRHAPGYETSLQGPWDQL